MRLGHRKWREFRTQVLATYQPICHICGKSIDLTLPGTHRLGPTVDHLVPRSRGGSWFDINNCRPAHLSCNSGKGNRQSGPAPRPQSRDW